MSSVVDPAVIDSVVKTVVQHVALSLRREGHLGGLGDSRRLRELVRQHVSTVVSESVDPNIETLLALTSVSIPKWAALMKAGGAT